MTRGETREDALHEVAEMYYEHGLTQREIGRRLGFSEMNVSRLLKAARKAGVVKIVIEPRMPRVLELEQELVNTYGLQGAVVVEATEENHIELVPEAAAQHIQLLLEPGIVIGVGVGPTVASVVSHLHHQRLDGAKVVQLAGGYHETGDVYSHDIVRNLSTVLSARGIYFHAPSVFCDVFTKNLVLRNVIDSSLMSYWEMCSLAVVTTNPIRRDSMLVTTGFISCDELEDLVSLGAAGSVLGNFFNDNGDFVDHELNGRVASVPIDVLRRVKNVVAVGRYAGRERSLLAGLRTGIIKTVVTDVKAARAALGASEVT